MRALAIVQPSRLDELEAVIQRGQGVFVEVGRALVEIRDGEVFRAAGYETFGEYLRERFPQLSRRSLYNAIAAAQVEADVDLLPSHLVELARLPPGEARHMADLAAARNLSVRELRALIRELRGFGGLRRPDLLEDRGPLELAPELECRLEVADCRALPFEDGDGHLDRRHGAVCGGADCPHPALVLESPPYNAGVQYADDPTGDTLPWRDYWHGLIVPHFREVYRVLQPGGRYACNLPNVARVAFDAPRADRRYRLDLMGRRQHAGAGGDAWATLVDRHVWPTWRRLGFLPRERFTWVKVNRNGDDDSGDPRDTITESTAWGTWASPENPVARAVAEPIFVASKSTYTRPRPAGAADQPIPRDRFLALTRNAWFVPNTVDRSRHPCPWPRGVPDNLIELYTWPADLVVNPFVGSGASAESAIELGRRFYGSDRSELYVHDAQHRAAAALRRAAHRGRYVEVLP